MDSKKTTTDTNHSSNELSKDGSLKSNKTDGISTMPDKQAADKLMTLNSSASAKDFNTRLQEIETKLHKITKCLDSNRHQAEQKHQEQLSTDEELALQIEGLSKSIACLNDHREIFEKTTVSLRKSRHGLQRSVDRIDKQNEQLESKMDKLSFQNTSNAQSERYHFQAMTAVLAIVAILMVLGLIYSLINQQNLWQFSMDNDVVIERRVNRQLSEQYLQMAQVEQNLLQAKQHRNQLINNISVLQTQLKGELKNIDENVQFLNTSVGSLKDYSRNTGKQILHGPSWLAQQPADLFTIQLISVDSKQKLYQYIEQYGYSLQDDLAWFSLNSKGKNYYILTYGRYQEKLQAHAALSQLPSFLTVKSPGISRIKDIQTYIH